VFDDQSLCDHQTVLQVRERITRVPADLCELVELQLPRSGGESDHEEFVARELVQMS
jgi:hypothetical protein